MRVRLLRRRLISGRDYFVNLIYSYAIRIIRVIDFISRYRILVSSSRSPNPGTSRELPSAPITDSRSASSEMPSRNPSLYEYLLIILTQTKNPASRLVSERYLNNLVVQSDYIAVSEAYVASNANTGNIVN